MSDEETLRVLVCGDRDWKDEAFIEMTLRGLSDEMEPSRITVIEGEARGADSMARDVALRLGYNVERYPANWNLYGKGAGPIRNQQMLDAKPDIVIAFHDDILHSKGTKDMVNRANKVGIPTMVLRKERV